MPESAIYKERKNKCVCHSLNMSNAGDSLEANGSVFVLHTLDVFTHHSKQEVKVN